MLTKRCASCRQEKPITEFNRDRGRKDGYAPYCRYCARKKERQYRINHKEDYNLYHRQYRAKKFKTVQGRYYGIKGNAKKRNINLNFGIGEFVEWFNNQDLHCYYCGRKVDINTTHELDSLVIDRKNNSLGYALNNIAIACQRCNLMKGSWLTEEMMLDIAGKYLKEKQDELSKENAKVNVPDHSQVGKADW